MQQSSAAEVRILIENLYRFKGFGGKKLIREFSDKGQNVKGLNKLLKTLRDSDNGRGRRRSVRSGASLVLQGTVRTYKE